MLVVRTKFLLNFIHPLFQVSEMSLNDAEMEKLHFRAMKVRQMRFAQKWGRIFRENRLASPKDHKWCSTYHFIRRMGSISFIVENLKFYQKVIEFYSNSSIQFQTLWRRFCVKYLKRCANFLSKKNVILFRNSNFLWKCCKVFFSE